MRKSFYKLSILCLILQFSACTPTFHQDIQRLNHIPFRAKFNLKKTVNSGQELSPQGTKITVLSDCGAVTCKQMQGELFGFTDQKLFVLEPKASCLTGVSISSVDYLVVDNAYHIDVLGFNERLFSLDNYARFKGNIKSRLEPFFLKCMLPKENPKDQNKEQVTDTTAHNTIQTASKHKARFLTPKRTAGINMVSRSLQKDWSLRVDMGGGVNLNFSDGEGLAENFTGLISFRPTMHLFSWLRFHLRTDLASKTRSGATSTRNAIYSYSEETEPQQFNDIRFSRKSHFLVGFGGEWVFWRQLASELVFRMDLAITQLESSYYYGSTLNSNTLERMTVEYALGLRFPVSKLNLGLYLSYQNIDAPLIFNQEQQYFSEEKTLDYLNLTLSFEL